VTLPLPLRNRLAEVILDAFHDGRARAILLALHRYCRGEPARTAALPRGFPAELFEEREGRLALPGAYRRFHEEFCERIVRAATLVAARPLRDREASLSQALADAAALFDVALHFEVHELLEPFWVRAREPAKTALQGLIQVAVGFHHLASGNLSGALALLEEGSAKLRGQGLPDIDLDPFAREVRRTLALLRALGADASRKFDWSLTPAFPRTEPKRNLVK
jgi:hypothetical protein